MADLRAYFEKLADGEAQPPPVARLLGFEVLDVGPDRAVLALDVHERHHNPMGTLHGGIFCDLADAAIGGAWATGLEEGESFTSLDLQVRFVRPVREGRIRAEARVLERGRRVGIAECDVLREDGERLARVTSTLMTLRGEEAAGR